MIAYFLLVHRYPSQFKRLFRAIYQPGNQYAVHIDKSSGSALADDISDFLVPYQGVTLLAGQHATWGGYSLVDAELRGMAALLEADADWTHYINLSGQDFPLKSQSFIRDLLADHPGRQFIRALDQQSERPDTMNRVDQHFTETLGTVSLSGHSRPFLADSVPYIGTQWKAVTREFCEFVCHDPRVDRFKQFYRNSFIADEGFFQSVAMNLWDRDSVMNDDLRMIDWVPDGIIKLRPRTYRVNDLAELKQSACLFARKFDESEDEAILGLLEMHLQTPGANVYTPLNRRPSEHLRKPMLPMADVVAA